MTAVNGVASFPGLTIGQPGSGYVLQATDDNLSGSTSGINVTPVGVATQLVVTIEPPGAVAAAPASP